MGAARGTPPCTCRLAAPRAVIPSGRHPCADLVATGLIASSARSDRFASPDHSGPGRSTSIERPQRFGPLRRAPLCRSGASGAAVGQWDKGDAVLAAFFPAHGLSLGRPVSQPRIRAFSRPLFLADKMVSYETIVKLRFALLPGFRRPGKRFWSLTGAWPYGRAGRFGPLGA